MGEQTTSDYVQHASPQSERYEQKECVIRKKKMYVWRFSIAVALGLVWYFYDCGRTVTQYIICFLFCFSTPLLFSNCGQESGTQTDEETKEDQLQVFKHTLTLLAFIAFYEHPVVILKIHIFTTFKRLYVACALIN